jgi:hypothetical protein
MLLELALAEPVPTRWNYRSSAFHDIDGSHFSVEMEDGEISYGCSLPDCPFAQPRCVW